VDRIRQVADAVLYEGYILWPYRRSALKNQRRFGWGSLGPGGAPELQAQVLLEGGGAVRVSVRCLQMVERQAYRGTRPVDELELDGERHLSWEEAVERELALEAPGRAAFEIEAGEYREELGEGAALVRRWEELRAQVEATVEELRPGLTRLTVRVEHRAGAEMRSPHVALRAAGGAFVSLTDPPPGLREEAEACVNSGVWPVLAGEEGDRSTMLASPIILPDHPQIAPESPGDLFDAGEIDQMLVLNILSLTDEEKREMRDSDPRAREILERTEALSDEELMRLHGAIREFGLARGP
jgi:hypothetical protein